MEIKIGDVYKVESGEGLKIVEHTEGGQFEAQIRGLNGKWTDLHINGDSARLPEFLSKQNAVKE